ncbi:MAG: hypothetical protein JNM83_28770 [Myxococcales bacterium]|nr:hypothetical protein [Myxococcales bacterium]
MSDFVPRSDAQLTLWLTNYSARLATYGKGLSLTDAEIKAQQKLADEIIDAIKGNDQKHKDWRSTVQATKTTKQTNLPKVRTLIARLKVAPGWSSAIGQAMGVISSSAQSLTPVVLAAAKPALRADVSAGRVYLKFTRRPFDGLNVYMRRKGEGTWRFVGRATKSPFVDAAPPLTAGSAEIREYQALGVRSDQELGQPSDIVVVPLRD